MHQAGAAASKLVKLKRTTDGGLGAEPPAAGQFFITIWKKKLSNAFKSHFARVHSHSKKQDFQHLNTN